MCKKCDVEIKKCACCGVRLGTKRNPFLVNLGGHKLPACMSCVSRGALDKPKKRCKR